MRICGVILILLSLLFGSLQTTFAQSDTSPDVVALSDEEVELRSREIGRALRCVVCQNQSIEESDASLAEDMRRLVRSRVKEGETNAEVINFMQDRYGDFVLLKPPVQSNTYVLWLAPFIIALLGILWFIRQSRLKKPNEISPLSEEEIERLKDLRSHDN